MENRIIMHYFKVKLKFVSWVLAVRLANHFFFFKIRTTLSIFTSWINPMNINIKTLVILLFLRTRMQI